MEEPESDVSEEEVLEENSPEITPQPQEPVNKTKGEGVRKHVASKFTKLELEIADTKVGDVPQFQESEKTEEQEALSDFSVEDARLLAQSLWNVPGAIFGDYMVPDKALVDRWGDQLFRYCERKGINMWDYAFDELPLAISTMMLGGSMVKKYSEHKKEEDEKKKEEGTSREKETKKTS